MIVPLPDFVSIPGNVVYIYELLDPRTRETRYIGKTINLKQRYRQHNSEARSGKQTYKNNWIKSLHKLNLKPIMRIIVITTPEYINEAEIREIACRKNLTNATSGGEGNCFFSEETKKKMSQNRKGKGLGRKGPASKSHLKPVMARCTETDIEICFNSLTTAAAYFQMNVGTIWNAINGNRKRAKNHTWSYINVTKI